MTRDYAIAQLRVAQHTVQQHREMVEEATLQVAAADAAVIQADAACREFDTLEDRIAQHHAETIRGDGRIGPLPAHFAEQEEAQRAAETHARRVRAARDMVASTFDVLRRKLAESEGILRGATREVIGADIDEVAAECVQHRDAYTVRRDQLVHACLQMGQGFFHRVAFDISSEPDPGPLRPHPFGTHNPWMEYRRQLETDPDASRPLPKSLGR